MDTPDPARDKYDKVEHLIGIANTLVRDWPRFITMRTPEGAASLVNAFRNELRSRAFAEFCQDYSGIGVRGEHGPMVDFYLPEESAIVELALDLRYGGGQFERTLLKALMAQSENRLVSRIVLLAKTGARARMSTRIYKAICEWAELEYGLSVEVRELGPGAEAIFNTEP